MNNDPCKVCGNTDMNLIDGFYYCVECGTQDTNIIDTVVDEVVFEDRTRAIRVKKKITTAARVVNKVSPEWHKWQSSNYVLSGMVKEMMDLGAGPKFKMRVMWLWTMYIKRYQNKAELGLSAEAEDDEPVETDRIYNYVRRQTREHVRDPKTKNISKVTVNILVTILFLALNFDRSDILVSDIVRYIREDRLSFWNSFKFIPEEIDPSHLQRIFKSANVDFINTQAMTFLKTLNLGSPIVPNLRKIVVRYVNELCLPDGFKDLVFSLMDLVPCDLLDLDKDIMKEIIRIPFYAARVMAYILVAIKLCFGLDGEYENKLSDAVDSINNENSHMKCYKLGVISTSSDRLFSFREWVNYLQLRKLVLGKCYLPLSVLYHMDVDDYVYMEHRAVKEPFRKQPSVTEDITMNLLEKIKTDPIKEVIPKKLFATTLTPFTDYTDVVLKYYHDSDVRLLLAEDFTKYNLKYAYETLELRVSDNSENIIVGVKETNKCIVSHFHSRIAAGSAIKRDRSLVYIRNCENKHWMKTKRPKRKHVKKVNTENLDDNNFPSDENRSDPDTDVSDSDTETIVSEAGNKKLELIKEDESTNIFDDDFQNLSEYVPNSTIETFDIKEEPIDEENAEYHSHDDDLSTLNNDLSPLNNDDPVSDQPIHSSLPKADILQSFNPETFDRADTVKNLILLACNDHKIAIPKEYKTVENEEPRKRKLENVNKEDDNENGVAVEKKTKKRTQRFDAKEQVNVFISAYHDYLNHGEVSSVSDNVQELVSELPSVQDDLKIMYIEDEEDGDLNSNVENFQNEFNHDNNKDNVDDPNSVNDDPSLVEIQNQKLDESVVSETETGYKGDPKFNDKIYDVKQLYLKTGDDNIEDIFNIYDDPDIAKLLTKKVEETDLSEPQPKIDKEKKDEFLDWDDEMPLSQIKEQMLEKKRAFENLEYLVANRENIKKNNYWIRSEQILSRMPTMGDTFTNDMKEFYPKSFTFLIMECAAMLDTTPFTLYKYMVRIEERLVGMFAN